VLQPLGLVSASDRFLGGMGGAFMLVFLGLLSLLLSTTLSVQIA
jgi:hypothetical protein